MILSYFPLFSRLKKHLQVFAWVCFGLSGSAVADDDFLVVPEGSAAPFEITHTNLTTNDAGSPTIHGHTAPSRGTLIDTGTSFTYSPSAEFLDVGLDQFTYQTSAGESRVILMRGLNSSLDIEGPGEEIAGVCQWGGPWQQPIGASGVTLVAAPSSGCALEFDMSQTTAAVEAVELPRIPTPGGGHTEMILDAGGGGIGGPSGSGAVIETYMIGADNYGQALFRLQRTDQNKLVVAALESDGTLKQTSGVDLPVSGAKVGLTWWFESGAGMRDGGMMLQINDELKKTYVGLENGPPVRLRWSFGPNDDLINTGLVVISATKIWSSDRAVRLYPLFLEHGRLANAWSSRVNPALITTFTPPGSDDPEWQLTVPPAGGSVQLVDQTASGSSEYNARFEIDTGGLNLPAFDQVTLFEATAVGSPDLPFHVQLRHQPTIGFQVRGKARHNTFTKTTPWITLAGDQAGIEVKWRAALAPSHPWTGSFFSLTVEDAGPAGGGGNPQLPVTETLTGLNNSHLSVEEVKVGMGRLPITASGKLIVDSFDSWR